MRTLVSDSPNPACFALPRENDDDDDRALGAHVDDDDYGDRKVLFLFQCPGCRRLRVRFEPEADWGHSHRDFRNTWPTALSETPSCSTN